MTSVVMGMYSSNAARSPHMLRITRVQQKRTAGEHQSGQYGLMVCCPGGAELAAWRDDWKSRHSEVSARVAGGGCSIWRDRGGK
jgi:hypothetical protein